MPAYEHARIGVYNVVYTPPFGGAPREGKAMKWSGAGGDHRLNQALRKMVYLFSNGTYNRWQHAFGQVYGDGEVYVFSNFADGRGHPQTEAFYYRLQISPGEWLVMFADNLMLTNWSQSDIDAQFEIGEEVFL